MAGRRFEPLRNSHEAGIHSVDLQHQIGELERVVAQLRDESSYHEFAYEQAANGMITFSMAGDILDLNPREARCLGLGRSKLIGRSFQSLLPPLTENAFMQHLEEALRDEAAVICELKVVDGEG
ncbi:MAG: PAS domain S-box protein [Oligoflexus sp.]|nr:PAS domain S-box protein [Oligoflexus sp.]